MKFWKVLCFPLRNSISYSWMEEYWDVYKTLKDRCWKYWPFHFLQIGRFFVKKARWKYFYSAKRANQTNIKHIFLVCGYNLPWLNFKFATAFCIFGIKKKAALVWFINHIIFYLKNGMCLRKKCWLCFTDEAKSCFVKQCNSRKYLPDVENWWSL